MSRTRRCDSLDRSLGILLFSLLSCFSCFGLEATPSLDPSRPLTDFLHQSWQTAQGLPQNSVLAIAQTPDKYIWLGTEEGLVRFDGVHFTVFDKTTVGLKSNLVLALLVDRHGDLWMGALGGGIAHLHNGAFQSFSTENGLPSNQVRALYEDKSGNIWIGTDGAGLVRFANGKFRTFTQTDGLVDNNVFSITSDRSGDLYVGTHSGISRFANGIFTTLRTRSDSSKDYVRVVYADADGSLWAGAADGLLHITPSGTRRFTAKDGLSSNTVFSIRRDAANSLWIGTANGLNRFANGDFHSLTEKDGFAGKDVWAIMNGSEGALWVGTGGGGLHALKSAPFTGKSKQDGLSSDLILSMLQGRDGSIWLGSDHGLMHLAGKKIDTFGPAQGLPDNFVFSLAQDPAGTIWIGTRRGLASLVNGRISTIKEFSNVFVLCTYIDRRGELWVGARNGLSHFSDGKVKTYRKEDGLTSNNVVAIFEDAQHVMWIGTAGGGLNRLEGGHFTTFSKKDGLASDIVWSIYGEPDGTLWLGTDSSGLIRYRAGRFSSYGVSAGLHDDNILAIADDHAGNLWLTSNKGIFEVSKSQLNSYAAGRLSKIRSIVYTLADGLKSTECNGGFQPAVLESQDGRLWFPTMKGFATVDPREANQHSTPAPLLERVVVNEKDVTPAEPLIVPPGKGQLEFHFTAPTSIAPEKVEFRYMLEGFDKEWSEAGVRRSAWYTNISPGEYRFRLEAGRNGIWNPAEATLSLTLQPHYYQTRAFTFLLALIGLAFCWMVYQLRVSQLKRSERRLLSLVDDRTAALRESEHQLRRSRDELEVRVQERTSELKLAKDAAEAANRAKSDFLAKMSHELRTPINGIVGMTEVTLATELKADQREYLELVKYSADSLLGIVNDILDFSKIEANKLTLEVTPFALRHSIRQLLQSLSLRARQKGIGLEWTIDPDVPDAFLGDPLRLRQVLLNLLDNALKFTSQGSVELTVDAHLVSAGDACLHFAVKDSGIGITPEKQQAIFEAFSQADTSSTRRYGGTGLGLTISSQLTELMGGLIWVESELGVGSTFHFTTQLERAERAESEDSDVAATASIAALGRGCGEAQPSASLDVQ